MSVQGSLVTVVDCTKQKTDRVVEKAEKECQEMKTFDGLLVNHLGQFGRFQCFLFVSLSVVALAVTWHNLVHVFTGAVPRFKCIAAGEHRKLPVLEDSVYSQDTVNHSKSAHSTERDTVMRYCDANQSQVSTFSSLSNTLLGLVTIPPFHDVLPFTSQSNSSLQYDDSCYKTVNSSSVSSEPEFVPCAEWKYDESQYKSSIVTDWDLVCDKKWLVSFVQSFHMLGCMVGALVFGELSDRFGRRSILLVTTLMQVVIAIASAFAPTFIVYAICRFVVGMADAGQYNCAYIIGLEILGPRWRGFAGVMMHSLGAFGIMIMSGLAYLVRQWRHLQLTVSVPLVLLFTYFFIAPESPRWLLTHKKLKAARKLIEKMAEYNKRTLPQDYADWLNHEGEYQHVGERQYSMADLFRSSRIRFRTLILCFLWFAISVTYYGLSLYTSNLGGSDYVNFFLSGAVELPAYLFSMWCIYRYGRRLPLSISMIASGVFLLVTSPLGDDQHTLRIVLSMAGKMCISVAFMMIYLFSAEMFPTVVRSNGLGFVTTGARVGGFVAPYVLLLGDISTIMPLVVCGGCAFAGGILAVLLPETKGKQLLETLEDAERMQNNSLRILLRKLRRTSQCNKQTKEHADKSGPDDIEQVDQFLPRAITIDQYPKSHTKC